jgi:hypothetical protein
MEKNYLIKDVSELVDYLKLFKKDAFEDFDYQLQTNYCFVFNLDNGQIVIIPNNFSGLGLLIENKETLNLFIKNDRFPIENPEQDLYDLELTIIKNIPNEINACQLHLNTILDYKFTELNKEVIGIYLKKIIGRTIKKLTTDKDVIALIIVIGEVLRREINGKWAIEKWYGTYNPKFKPRIVNMNSELIFIDDLVWSNIKWKISDIEMIMCEREGIALKDRNKFHQCTLLET